MRQTRAWGFDGTVPGPTIEAYGEDRHWVSGNLRVSEWLLTGTTPDGRRVRADRLAPAAPRSVRAARGPIRSMDETPDHPPPD